MNETERQLVFRLLGDNPTQDDISRAAAALVQHRAEQEVASVARILGPEARTRNQREIERWYYCFLGPKPKPVKLSSEGGVELWQQPGRQEYRVRVHNLPEFCREMKLDLSAMQDVALGKRHDYRDWLGNYTGANYDAGRSWRDPEPGNRAAAARKAAAAKQGPWVKQSVYPPTPPVIEWQPSK